ncbi:hypothetical protein L873DRAFT_1905400 [Choiromyces venosus 120613-1]|uniref:Uncharacterized protein n=1 Tax=Choiromyces venosus 120613-1 TaxID=1336337 RepID=A0A3N4JMT5_9PEZI|nr:hypothetical protein L873DRAFT_1905400 [Choiromyces venosus 120613-1]
MHGRLAKSPPPPLNPPHTRVINTNQIDFEKLAHKMNYKSGAVANARFHQIKRAVIKASELTPTSPPSAPPPAPAAAAAKKAVEKKRVEKVAEDGVVKKRGRGRPRKVVVAPAAPVEPMGGEGGRGERAFGEDFGGVAGAGGIDPRILEMGGGRRVKVEKEEEGEDEEEADTEVEGEEGKGVRFVF